MSASAHVDTTEIGIYQRVAANKFRELTEILDGLPIEALTWKPFDQSPWHGAAGSLGWLIAHSASSTIYLLRRAEWILARRDWAEVQGDEGSDEFGPANLEPGYLAARLTRAQGDVTALLDSLSADDLAGARVHPQRSELTLTVRYDIQHALEHMSQHIGHAALTRQLWALQQPSGD